ncbi:hypothetical protein LY90DRAFT_674523 [Neocallimastix californiae]|uniref:Uncharacterized protein n=1 Tax=Neocallimastix californiae TaxID=1754190 RepID=A0A1Y2AVM7_9FUNG|nr:hypothetical protein LY90DRAFT_674523 [Neocallimastix californiae]|eukprot:ORY26643.1 hypothetical protein LY90DRAFT_674523 [Neocallimastix californiae]
MKFIYKFVILSTTFKLIITKNLDKNFVYSNNEECYKAVYSECSIPINFEPNEIKSICDRYDSDKCKKRIADGISILPDCMDKEESYLTYLYQDFKQRYTHMELICAKDVEGKFCPYTDYYIENGNNNENKKMNETKFWNYINESCKSKTCTDVINKVLMNPKASIFNSKNINKEFIDDKEIKLFHKAIKYMKTIECTSQLKKIPTNSTINNQNDISILDYSPHLLLTLGLLLYTLI